jgi:hypothetical protein
MRKLVMATLFAALLLTLSACGRGVLLSPDEYRGKAYELQDGVNSTLKEARDGLCGVDPYGYFELQALQLLLEESASGLGSAYRQALGMNVPPQVEEIHEGMLNFYSYVEEKIGDMASASAFFYTVRPMLTDVSNLALPATPEDAEVSRLKAVSEEDVATMHGYIKDLEGIESPPELRPYQENLITFFHSIQEDVAEVERAVKPGDITAFQEFKERFQEVEEKVRVLDIETAVYIFFFCERVELFLLNGEDLARRIEEI